MALATMAGLTACSDSPTGGRFDPTADLECSIPTSEIFDGQVGRDGIPALTDPEFVVIGNPSARYLLDQDRVVVLELGDETLAIPHNILWWHEIVNLNRGSEQVAVSYCPLTGSSIVFDRSSVAGAEFGVSGLLYRNNLIMYDRTRDDSLWPQMARGARCGPETGAQLQTVAAQEMTWGGFRRLHPDGLVVGDAIPFDRDYTRYPYGAYEALNNRDLLYPQANLDNRRPWKERVLGIPTGDGGIAFPFVALGREEIRAIHLDVGGARVVVFWDGSAETAQAFRADLDGEGLTFQVVDGRIADVTTGSLWRADGRATEGTLADRRLEPVPQTFVAFWFAWAAFQPNTELWAP